MNVCEVPLFTENLFKTKTIKIWQKRGAGASRREEVVGLLRERKVMKLEYCQKMDLDGGGKKKSSHLVPDLRKYYQ